MTGESRKVRIIGGGLAGCEAALLLSKHGVEVELIEMKPKKQTPAQVSDKLAELVCSNSFRSNDPHNAVGLLKEEMRLAGSFLMKAAQIAKVPAGGALAVDRIVFSDVVEKEIANAPNITLTKSVVDSLPDDSIPTIVATGPLTTDSLATSIREAVGASRLAFYDAIAPIVDVETIDMEHAFWGARWGKGDGDDYLNCPMTKEEYLEFYDELTEADQAKEKSFEKLKYFEGCLPLEEMAKRGVDTLLYGPLKPVGLFDPKTDERAYAVLQLRKENIHGTALNLVGCQTRMTWGDQKHVFRLIPALKNVSFLRYGSLHRNTYLDAPNVMDENLRMKRADKKESNIYFAGQITGVEGYVESIACAILLSLVLLKTFKGEEFIPPPETTAMGGLYRHIRGALRCDKDNYVPSNINWSMIAPIEKKFKGKEKRKLKRSALSERALSDFKRWMAISEVN